MLADERTRRHYRTTPRQQANTACRQLEQTLWGGMQGSHVINSHLARKPRPYTFINIYHCAVGTVCMSLLAHGRECHRAHHHMLGCVRVCVSERARLSSKQTFSFVLLRWIFDVFLLLLFLLFGSLLRLCMFKPHHCTFASRYFPSHLLGAQLCFFTFPTRYTTLHNYCSTTLGNCGKCVLICKVALVCLCVRCVSVFGWLHCSNVRAATTQARLPRRCGFFCYRNRPCHNVHTSIPPTNSLHATWHGAALCAALSQCYYRFSHAPSPPFAFAIE